MDENRKREYEKAMDVVNNTRGLLCFSKSFENPVMWSHYADKNRGVCLGFDIPDADIKMRDVVYLNEPFTLKSISREEANLLARCKFKDWDYENESRRFISLSDCIQESDLYFYPFSDELILREIILGIQCETSIKDIKELVRNYELSPSLFKAKMSSIEFKIQKELVNPL